MEIIASKDEWDRSIVCNLFFITFLTCDRSDSCSRADTHGAKIFPGLIKVNIIRLDIFDKHLRIGDSSFETRL